jgi:hypothetical protein
MRLLFTIPHYVDPQAETCADGLAHGSVGKDPQRRVSALTTCVSAIHHLFHHSECYIDHVLKVARHVTPRTSCAADVVICTTGSRHILAELPLPGRLYMHRPTDAEPALLGFECHALLRAHLGQYDYYCYLEDDLVLHDPWFFVKLAWFTKVAGEDRLLQPNRYEVGDNPLVGKVYVDGEVAERVTAGYQNVHEQPRMEADVLGRRILFRRPTNPHAGCFFLSAAQMQRWAAQPYFLDRDTGFIGPLESDASLGIMRTFKVYKPALEDGAFFEIQHHGESYLNMIGHREASEPAGRDAEGSRQ